MEIKKTENMQKICFRFEFSTFYWFSTRFRQFAMTFKFWHFWPFWPLGALKVTRRTLITSLCSVKIWCIRLAKLILVKVKQDGLRPLIASLFYWTRCYNKNTLNFLLHVLRTAHHILLNTILQLMVVNKTVWIRALKTLHNMQKYHHCMMWILYIEWLTSQGAI